MEDGTLQASMNVFDLGVYGILGLSGLLSFFRGFVREVLSLGAWVGASIITLYWFPDVADWLEPQMKDSMAASGIAAMGTFMGSLVVISIFNSILLKFLKTGAEIGLLDNGLGLLFGIARGALLISVAYFIMSVIFVKEENYPVWVKEATTRPYAEEGALWIGKVAPEYLEKLSPLEDNGEPNLIERTFNEDGEEEDNSDEGSRWESMEDLQDRMRSN